MFRLRQRTLHTHLEKWLFRLREAESGEVFLNQRRVFILPTPAGLAFGVMLIALFIGSVNYNLSLGFALTFLLVGCVVIDIHLTFRNLAHLSLATGRVHSVFVSEEAQFELHLINRRKHNRYAIWLDFTNMALTGRAQAADVAPHSDQRVVLSVPTVERGWLPLPRIRLQTRFPLGLFRAWSYWQPDAKALIYPRPEDNAPPLPLHKAGTQDGQGQAGQDDFAGIRSYQAGDSLKHLAWRQIARIDTTFSSTLVTKHFEGGAASELWLDFSKLPRNMDIEQKLSRITRWVLEAEAHGLSYGFRLGPTVLPAAIGPSHQTTCLQALALYEGT